MKEEQFIVSLIVDNHFGVLTRIAGLFAKRGFNIDSLTVGETQNPQFSRMTIVSSGDDYKKEQFVKQLEKIVDVRKVVLMEKDSTVVRELVLIKLKTNGNSNKLLDIAKKFGANVVDLSQGHMTLELALEQEYLEQFIKELEPYGIVEIGRTGATALGRGLEIIKMEAE